MINLVTVIYCNYCEHKKVLRGADFEKHFYRFNKLGPKRQKQKLIENAHRFKCDKCHKKNVEIQIEDDSGEGAKCDRCGAPSWN
jgi:DNA-directed RNA polymerase subunit RPC12/RpoP